MLLFSGIHVCISISLQCPLCSCSFVTDDVYKRCLTISSSRRRSVPADLHEARSTLDFFQLNLLLVNEHKSGLIEKVENGNEERHATIWDRRKRLKRRATRVGQSRANNATQQILHHNRFIRYFKCTVCRLVAIILLVQGLFCFREGLLPRQLPPTSLTWSRGAQMNSTVTKGHFIEPIEKYWSRRRTGCRVERGKGANKWRRIMPCLAAWNAPLEGIHDSFQTKESPSAEQEWTQMTICTLIEFCSEQMVVNKSNSSGTRWRVLTCHVWQVPRVLVICDKFESRGLVDLAS